MNTDDGFDFMVAVAFTISPKLVFIGPKTSDIMTSLTLQSGETIPDLDICTLRFCINIIMIKDETLQTNALTGTYICEISKLPDIHRYINKYETEY